MRARRAALAGLFGEPSGWLVGSPGRAFFSPRTTLAFWLVQQALEASLACYVICGTRNTLRLAFLRGKIRFAFIQPIPMRFHIHCKTAPRLQGSHCHLRRLPPLQCSLELAGWRRRAPSCASP